MYAPRTENYALPAHDDRFEHEATAVRRKELCVLLKALKLFSHVTDDL